MEQLIHYLYALVDASDYNPETNEGEDIKIKLDENHEMTVGEIYSAISVLEEASDTLLEIISAEASQYKRNVDILNELNLKGENV